MPSIITLIARLINTNMGTLITF